jgi:hypothetical protein
MNVRMISSLVAAATFDSPIGRGSGFSRRKLACAASSRRQTRVKAIRSAGEALKRSNGGPADDRMTTRELHPGRLP